jgi:hypothetical protein
MLYPLKYLSLFLMFSHAAAIGQVKPKPIVGCWHFIADQELDETGKVIRQDKQVDGMLIYTPEGYISVQFYWRGKRQPMITDSIMYHDGLSYGLGLGVNSWSTDEARKILDTYDAYFGCYLLNSKSHIVTHIVSGNLRPEKSGITYKRRYILKGDSLFLRSTDPKMKWQAALVRVKY